LGQFPGLGELGNALRRFADAVRGVRVWPVSTDPATDPVALDEATLRDLFRLLASDREVFDEIVSAFLEEAPLRLADLHDGVTRGDAELVARAAHMLKANGATFGARELESRSRALEEAARLGDLSGAAESVELVESSWGSTRVSLARLLADGPPA
jgi:HPt (histidine-containing phosphotransfer) domain-containing protein